MVRVQMVCNRVPAYQKDFDNVAEAQRVAKKLAEGAKAVEVNHTTDLLRFEGKGKVVRVFELQR